MILILIFGLILTMAVPRSEGVPYNWTGTFESQPDCDTDTCCCLWGDLVIKQASGNAANGTIMLAGSACKASNGSTITITDVNQNKYNISSVGSFTINQNGNLEVLLEQNNSTGAACQFNMIRKSSPSINNNNNETTTRKTNEASSNHGSTLIKFISIMMITLVIRHI